MVKHIILWQLKDELSAAEKAEIKANIKTGLEGLAGQIPGCLLYTSPSPRDAHETRMPSSA